MKHKIIKYLIYAFVFIVLSYCLFFIAIDFLALLLFSQEVDQSIQPVSNIALKTSGITLPKQHEVLRHFHAERDGNYTEWVIVSKDPFKTPSIDSTFYSVNTTYKFFNDYISNQSYKIKQNDIIFSHSYSWEINYNLDFPNKKKLISIKYLKTKYFYYLYFSFWIRGH